MLSFSVLWIYIIYARITTAEWIMNSQSLPDADNEQAVGEYNGTIFILGGWSNQLSYTTYHIATETLTVFGGALTDSTIGSTQYWTQQNHIVYMIAYGSYLNTFNMMTREFTQNLESITIPIDTYLACLASDAEFLYITGGYIAVEQTGRNELQILSLSTKQWIYNAPSMQEQERNSHGCIVHNEYLWVFTGSMDRATPDEPNTNERISTIDIVQHTWNFIDPFTMKFHSVRVAAFDNTIYVIGGQITSYETEYLDIVHLVDVTTGAVAVSSDRLLFQNYCGAPIVVDAVLYVFGGFYDSNKWQMDAWMYYPLATSNPSTSPSKYATLYPSNDPSTSTLNNPTVAPSIIISSNIPSASPSNDRMSVFSSTSTGFETSIHTWTTASKIATLDPTTSQSLFSSETLFRPIESQQTQIETTVSVTDNMDSKDISQQSNPLLNKRTLVAIIAAILFLIIITIICIIILGYAIYRKKKNAQIVQMGILQPDNDNDNANVAHELSENIENMDLVMTVEGDLGVGFRRNTNTAQEGKQYEEKDHDITAKGNAAQQTEEEQDTQGRYLV